MKNQVFSEARKAEFDPPAREAVKRYYESLGCQVEDCVDVKSRCASCILYRKKVTP